MLALGSLQRAFFELLEIYSIFLIHNQTVQTIYIIYSVCVKIKKSEWLLLGHKHYHFIAHAVLKMDFTWNVQDEQLFKTVWDPNVGNFVHS